MNAEHPKGFPYAIKTEAPIEFAWFERLRIAFGRPAKLTISIFCQENPGAFIDGGTFAEVKPIGGKNGAR